jgi:hypothetical protein
MSCCVGLATVPRVASAAPPKGAPAKKPIKAGSAEDAKRAEARNHYADAEARYQSGDFEGAYAGYKAANDLMMASQTLFKMALCLDKLDKSSEAISAYQAFLSSNPPGSMDAKVSDAQGRIADLKKKVPALVHIKSEPPSATVTLDGTAQSGATPLDVKTSSGHHRIRVTVTGYDPFEKELDLEPGSEATVEAPLSKSTSEAPPAPATAAETPPVTTDKPPSAEAEPHSNAAAYIVLGLAGAGAVVGGIFGVKALGEKSDYDNAAPADRTSDMADAVERDALIADMALGAALTLGVTGVVLLVTNASPPASNEKQARLAPAKRFELTPLFGQGRTGAAATLHF